MNREENQTCLPQKQGPREPFWKFKFVLGRPICPTIRNPQIALNVCALL